MVGYLLRTMFLRGPVRQPAAAPRRRLVGCRAVPPLRGHGGRQCLAAARTPIFFVYVACSAPRSSRFTYLLELRKSKTVYVDCRVRRRPLRSFRRRRRRCCIRGAHSSPHRAYEPAGSLPDPRERAGNTRGAALNAQEVCPATVIRHRQVRACACSSPAQPRPGSRGRPRRRGGRNSDCKTSVP